MHMSTRVHECTCICIHLTGLTCSCVSDVAEVNFPKPQFEAKFHIDSTQSGVWITVVKLLRKLRNPSHFRLSLLYALSPSLSLNHFFHSHFTSPSLWSCVSNLLIRESRYGWYGIWTRREARVVWNQSLTRTVHNWVHMSAFMATVSERLQKYNHVNPSSQALESLGMPNGDWSRRAGLWTG